MSLFILLLFASMAGVVFMIGLFDVIREMGRQAKDVRLLSKTLKAARKVREELNNRAKIQ